MRSSNRQEVTDPMGRTNKTLYVRNDRLFLRGTAERSNLNFL